MYNTDTLLLYTVYFNESTVLLTDTSNHPTLQISWLQW